MDVTFRPLDTAVPCVAQTEVVTADVPHQAQCSLPAREAGCVAVDELDDADPRRNHTVFPVCPTHRDPDVVLDLIGRD